MRYNKPMRKTVLLSFLRPCALRLFATFALSAVISFSSICQTRADDWPQWLGPKRDSVWRETGIIEKFPGSGPAVLWRTPVGGGYSGPTVADGRVYVTDRELATGANNPTDPF